MNEPRRTGLEDIGTFMAKNNIMTFQRYLELRRLEAEGKLSTLPTWEIYEYEQFHQNLGRTRRDLRDLVGEVAADAGSRVTTTTGEAGANVGSVANAEAIEPNPNAVVERWLEVIAGKVTEQHLQDAQNATYLKLMADTLVETKAARESADRRADQQASTNKRFTIVALVLAFASVVVPFVIEGIKGWQ